MVKKICQYASKILNTALNANSIASIKQKVSKVAPQVYAVLGKEETLYSLKAGYATQKNLLYPRSLQGPLASISKMLANNENDVIIWNSKGKEMMQRILKFQMGQLRSCVWQTMTSALKKAYLLSSLKLQAT